MKTPKDVQQLAINWHVAKRILRLAMKIACCFYANQAVTPSKGWPFKFVDFITSKTRPSRQEGESSIVLEGAPFVLHGSISQYQSRSDNASIDVSRTQHLEMAVLSVA